MSTVSKSGKKVEELEELEEKAMKSYEIKSQISNRLKKLSQTNKNLIVESSK